LTLANYAKVVYNIIHGQVCGEGELGLMLHITYGSEFHNVGSM